MIPGRLFTFGCSYTRYFYPTWADILGQQWEYSENWGKPGAGNHYIFNSIIECLNRNEFTKNDTIMILWTSISRTDYYQKGHWYSLINEFSDNKDVAINCPDGFELTNYPLMYSIHEILTHKKIKYQSMRWTLYDDTSAIGQIYKDTINQIEKYDFSLNKTYYKLSNSNNFMPKLTELYKNLAGPDWPSLDQILDNNYKVTDRYILQELENFKKMIYQEDKKFFISLKETDQHPLPLEHLEVAKKMCPDLKISLKTLDLVKNTQEKILKGDPMRFVSNTPKDRISI